jgi:hypothetical protein
VTPVSRTAWKDTGSEQWKDTGNEQRIVIVP